MINRDKVKNITVIVSTFIIMAVYLIFMISLFLEVLKSCLTEILIRDRAFTIVGIDSNFRFYLYFISIFLLLLIVYRVINALFFLFTSIIKTRRFINDLNITEEKEDFKIFYSQKAYVFTSGFFNPQIYISSSLIDSLSNKELLDVINHEKSHKLNYDPLFKLLSKFFIKAFVPVPFSKEIIYSYILMRERVANINLSLAFKIFELNKREVTVSNYGENIFSSKKHLKLYIALFSVCFISLTFVSLTKVFAANSSSEVSVCEDETSCLLLERSDNIQELPGQCKEILYSPIPEYSGVSVLNN